MTTHRWRDQLPGDPRRAGCTRCGAERDDTVPGRRRYRAPTDRTWTNTPPPCRSARNRYCPPNPENALRLRRTCSGRLLPAPPAGERCARCGYGASVSETARKVQDQIALARLLVLERKRRELFQRRVRPIAIGR